MPSKDELKQAVCAAIDLTAPHFLAVPETHVHRGSLWAGRRNLTPRPCGRCPSAPCGEGRETAVVANVPPPAMSACVAQEHAAPDPKRFGATMQVPSPRA